MHTLLLQYVLQIGSSLLYAGTITKQWMHIITKCNELLLPFRSIHQVYLAISNVPNLDQSI